MQPDARDAAYLWDILDAAEDICKFTKDMDLDQYLRDRMTQAAVERKAGIIGEAARQISNSYKKTHPEVPWRKIIAQRNLLVHEYGDVIQERMWDFAVKFIPKLITLLAPLIPPIPRSPEDENT